MFPLLYCLLAFTLIIVVNDLFDHFSDFLESGVRPVEILYYYSQLLPPVAVLTLPACLLLAMLYSLSSLTRHNEITAMRAGGVSIYRIVWSYVGVGIVAGLLTAFLNEKVAPSAGWRAEQFLKFQQSGRDENVFDARNLALKDRNHVWLIRRLKTRERSMYGVELIQQREDGSDEVKIQAEKALWLDGRWWFMNLTIQHYRPNGDLAGPPESVLQQEMRDLHETPQTFFAEIKDPRYFSSSELLRSLDTKRDISDSARTRMEVDLHSRLATPFICLVVVLIGVPVGAHTGRRGAFVGIMLAMSLFFAFYILQLVSQAVGKQEMIPAWLAGWLPVIVFGVGSPFWIHRMR